MARCMITYRRIGPPVYGIAGRVCVYCAVVYLFGCCCESCLLLVITILLSLKLLQLIGGTSWILAVGERATQDLVRYENCLEPNLDVTQRIDTIDAELNRQFANIAIRCSVFGMRDRAILDFANRLINNDQHRLVRFFGTLMFYLHDLFFRFKTLSIFAMISLVAFATPMDASSPCWIITALLCIVGLLTICMCYIMAGEIMIGTAIMGSGYSRYFHKQYRHFPIPPTSGRRHLNELVHFTELALVTLVVISGVCAAVYIMFGGFAGLNEATHDYHGTQRILVWLHFLYFATTTFCTVGFGDIHPTALYSRILVTAIHFLTFGYVLFLLQTLLSYRDISVDDER